MFKRFDPSTDCSTSTQVKSSVQRGIKSFIMSSHELIDSVDLEDVVLPKKPPLMQYKVAGGAHAVIYCQFDKALFFQSRDGPILPTLKLVHMYPNIGWTTITVDEGAIPYVLGGANIMCPGLTNPGGSMPEQLEKGHAVVIMAQSKQHAIAVGVMKMSVNDIRSKNKGVAVEVNHFLGDGLYNTIDIS